MPAGRQGGGKDPWGGVRPCGTHPGAAARWNTGTVPRRRGCGPLEGGYEESPGTGTGTPLRGEAAAAAAVRPRGSPTPARAPPPPMAGRGPGGRRGGGGGTGVGGGADAAGRGWVPGTGYRDGGRECGAGRVPASSAALLGSVSRIAGGSAHRAHLPGCSRFLPSSSSVCPGISSDPGRVVAWSLNPCPVLPQTRVRNDRRGSSWRLARSERASSPNKAGEGKQMLPGGSCLNLSVSTARRPCVEMSSENEARGTNRQRRCRRDSVLWRILMKICHRHPFK